ncbi:hypothetical protein CHELA40_13684 [Chelatococcus asaccharovorans]|nr:hypothetical protein CHELA40_13684 [Chelatococcus asaccharovorans]CAH1676344.1 hypothetical protein CHELA17_61941 [Chelatococcus asaccharovorans]
MRAPRIVNARTARSDPSARHKNCRDQAVHSPPRGRLGAPRFATSQHSQTRRRASLSNGGRHRRRPQFACRHRQGPWASPSGADLPLQNKIANANIWKISDGFIQVGFAPDAGHRAPRGCRRRRAAPRCHSLSRASGRPDLPASRRRIKARPACRSPNGTPIRLPVISRCFSYNNNAARVCVQIEFCLWTERKSLSIRRLRSAFRPVRASRNARVAQLVEHATENRSVGGSIPPPGTTCPS